MEAGDAFRCALRNCPRNGCAAHIALGKVPESRWGIWLGRQVAGFVMGGSNKAVCHGKGPPERVRTSLDNAVPNTTDSSGLFRQSVWDWYLRF